VEKRNKERQVRGRREEEHAEKEEKINEKILKIVRKPMRERV